MPAKKEVKQRKRRKRGVVEVLRARNGEYYFRIQCLINGKIIARSSETYNTAYGARKGVYSMLNIVFDSGTEIIWPKSKRELKSKGGK